MKTQRIKLKKIVLKITKGTTPTTIGFDFVDYGINYIKAEALNGDSELDMAGCAYINDDAHNKLKRSILKKNDVLVTIAGVNIGKTGIVNQKHLPANTNQAVGIVRIKPDLANSKYIYYWFKNPLTFKLLQSINAQAAQPNINLQMLGNLSLLLPDIQTQEKIADIFSTYDDLIGTNRRRIELLEESARLLFREWFVYFRYPGHEKVKIVDGVPDGWERINFMDIICTIESGGRPKGGAIDEGIPSIGAENVNGIGNYNYSKEKYVSEEYYQKMKKGKVISKDVLLYKDGANIGRTTLVGYGYPHDKCCINEHVFILRTKNKIQNWLYFFLSQNFIQQAVANLNSNSAQPGISQDKLSSLKIKFPDEEIVRLFDDVTESIVKQIFILSIQNQKLTQARDLLLPRLMSGAIEV